MALNQFLKKIDDLIFLKMKTVKNLYHETQVPEPTISKWINQGTEISAFYFYKIVHALEKNKNEQEKLKMGYLQNLKAGSCINTKILFILSYLNRDTVLFTELLQHCSKHKYLIVRKYAKAFQFYQRRLQGEDIHEIYLELKTFQSNINKKEKDLAILCDLLSIMILLDLGDIKLVPTYRNRIKRNLIKIGGSHLKMIYHFLFIELHSYYLLRRNQITLFQRHNQSLQKLKNLDFFPVMKGALHLKAGESYLLSNYNMAIYNLEKSLEIFHLYQDESRYKQALNDLNFVRISHWRDIDKIDFKQLHPAEQALFYIELGQNDKAIILLDDLERKNGKLTALQICYKGMATLNLSLIQQSIQMFQSNNDFFFVQYAQKAYQKVLNQEQTIKS
ncbi:AimR family lysis-lysogeny pheromone receptor [Bacillus cereus]|uniref:Transcriptional regulator n=1 Tax=Bacillus cereus TaxID=1396 RepID=A0A2B9EF23_BACCE|nr:AimR family lysis-lysogeny pheromone receptor [Bacillus cereus]PGM97969.1 transcriptional regulator [Bacillus cereus]